MIWDGVFYDMCRVLYTLKYDTSIYELPKCGAVLCRKKITVINLNLARMNVLITSSIRIDKNQPPAVGPSSANGFSVSKDTTIFIRRSFIEWYGDLRQRGFNDLFIRELYPFDEYAQLRQVRFKFHRATTYLLSRSCSIFANDLCSRPVTIRTLAGHNTGTNKDSDAKIASQLFRAVAASVWEQGENAILSRHCVDDLQKKCKTNGKVWNIVDEILSLFNDSSTTNIIGNEQLNRPLTNLANEISSSHHCKCRSGAHRLSNLRHMNKQFFSWSSESKWISLSIKQMTYKFLLYAMNFEYVLPWI